MLITELPRDIKEARNLLKVDGKLRAADYPENKAVVKTHDYLNYYTVSVHVGHHSELVYRNPFTDEFIFLEASSRDGNFRLMISKSLVIREWSELKRDVSSRSGYGTGVTHWTQTTEKLRARVSGEIAYVSYGGPIPSRVHASVKDRDGYIVGLWLECCVSPTSYLPSGYSV
jgi:hypothetical protein